MLFLPDTAHKLENAVLDPIAPNEVVVDFCFVFVPRDHVLVELADIKLYGHDIALVVVQHVGFRHRENLNVHILLGQIVSPLHSQLDSFFRLVGLILICEKENSLCVILLFD